MDWPWQRLWEASPDAKYRDYSLDGPESDLAVKKGLASGQWYVPNIPRKTLRRLMQRDDHHALRDTAILFTLIFTSAAASYFLWHSGCPYLAAVSFWVYCTLYTSSGDSRWHEAGHGTAFKTKWMNDWLYEIASFMVFREPTVWQFSHARHHTDTDVVGRDPEADGRPLTMWNLFLAFFNYQGIQGESRKIWMHAWGTLSSQEKTFVPSSERFGVFRKARIWLGVYCSVVLASLCLGTPVPMMYTFLPYTLGAWHFVLVGVFQHASLQQDVLDHRLNTRTVYINPVSAFIYWNMQYHIEHHMFPMVPYYNLPALHQELKSQLPPPYNSMWEVYKEMIPALIRQCSDPKYYTDRSPVVPAALPPSDDEASRSVSVMPDKDGWVAACMVDEVALGDMLGFSVGPRSYVVYHAEDDQKWYATAAKCTHGAAELSDGLVTGNLIECPKHNGCFDFKTGLPKRLPVKLRLATFPVKVEKDTVYVQVGGGRHVGIGYDKEE